MHHELRIYEIFPENKTAFHARFRDHALRVFARHGFNILSLWETEHEGKPRFVYLLAWSDDATREAAWKAMLADPEWTEIKKRTAAEHGTLVGKTEGWILRGVGYGPGA